MIVAACIFGLMLFSYQLFAEWEKRNRWTREKDQPKRFFTDHDDEEDDEASDVE